MLKTTERAVSAACWAFSAFTLMRLTGGTIRLVKDVRRDMKAIQARG